MKKILSLLFILFVFHVQAQQVQICTWKNNAKGAYNIIHDDFGDYGVSGIQNYADTMNFNRGLKFTFGAITSSCEGNPGMYTIANRLISHKHEIINHSHTHSCAIGSGSCGGTGVNYQWAVPGTTDRLNIEVDQSTTSIFNNTGMSPRFYIYPYDQFNANANTYLQNKGYIGSRTGAYNSEASNSLSPNTAGFFQTPLVVDVTTSGSNTYADNLNFWVDQAITNNSWVNRELHNVGPTGWGHVEISDYRTHLNYIKTKVDAGDLWVGTISEILTYQIQKLNYTPTSSYNSTSKVITVNWNAPSFNVATYLSPLQVKSPITLSINLASFPGNYTVSQNGTNITDFFIKNNVMYVNVYPHQGSVVLTPLVCANICISSQPASVSIMETNSTTLSVLANSQESMSYQWYFNNNIISGATSSTYTISNATTAQAGSYTVKITTASYNTTSNAAIVTVNTQTPFAGVIPIPGTIQMENFDIGGQNISYNESSSINEGDAPTYRTEPVDIENNGTGGYDVGYITNGEWLEYTVNVASTGTYNFIFTLASQNVGQANGQFKVDLNASPIITTQTVVFTGGWATWRTQTVSNINLTAGQHVLRFTAIRGDFNIDKIEVNAALVAPTITIATPTKTYGDAAFNIGATSNSSGALSYSITAGNTVASINASGIVTILNSGVATIQINQAAAAGFTTGTQTVTLTVNKKQLTVTANNQTKVYNTANPTLTLSYNGFVNSETTSVLTNQATATTTALVNSNVGTYPISASGATATNYSFVYVNGTLTISAATPTITFANITKTYGDVAFNLSATSNSLGAITYSIVSGNTLVNLNAGNINILGAGAVVIQASVTANGNYSALSQNATLTIAKKVLTITANDQSKTVNTANPTLTITYTGFAYSDNIASLTSPAVANTAATLSSPIGDYTITVIGASSNNYSFNYVAGTLSITNVVLQNPVITFNNANKTYGDVPFDVVATSTSGGALSYSITAGSSYASITPAGRVTILGAGNITIQVSQVANGIYTSATQTATLTIAKKDLQVIVNNETRFVNATNPNFTINYNGFVYNETSSNLNVLATASTTATIASAAGSYIINVSGAQSLNYNFIYTTGSLTVIDNQNPTFSFNDINKTYGDANFSIAISSNAPGAITYSIISGNTVLQVASNGDASILSAGTAILQVSQAASNGFNSITKTCTLTVAKKLLTVSTQNESRIENTPNPVFQIFYNGFINGESENDLLSLAIATTTANTSSIAGSYPIVLNGASSNNYDIQYQNGLLTVQAITATNELMNEQSINLYPNPTTNNSTLQVNSALVGQLIKIIDSHGQIIYSGIIQNETTALNTSMLSSGLYTLLFENGNSLKFIKN